MFVLSLEFEDKDGEYLNEFAAKVGKDWRGVVMLAMAMVEITQEKVLKEGKAVVLTGEAYGPFAGVMISPWESESVDETKPLCKVLGFPAKKDEGAP